MADAAFSRRFLWSIVRFCGVIFTLEADILQVRDVYDGLVSLICHIVHTILSIIPEIVLSEEHGTNHSEILTENGAFHQQEKIQVARARY